MSSSTSSSDGRGEWRLVLALGCALMLLEAGTRAWVARSEARAASDPQNVRHLSRVADAIRDHAGHSVLVLGNSRAHDGVRADVLREAVRQREAEDSGADVFLATPSGTSATHWDYALRRYFTLARAVPDEVFLCGHPRHFADLPAGSRLRAFFVADADFVRALRDTSGWDSKVDFILARMSALWSTDTKLRARFFTAMVPHYQEMEFRLQKLRWSLARPEGKTDTFSHLDHILQELRERHVSAHLVGMPTLGDMARMDEGVRELARKDGADVIDLTAMTGLDEDSYHDGVHLNEKGAELFSRQLALAINEHR